MRRTRGRQKEGQKGKRRCDSETGGIPSIYTLFLDDISRLIYPSPLLSFFIHFWTILALTVLGYYLPKMDALKTLKSSQKSSCDSITGALVL